MLQELSGRTAFITGGAQGIGLGMARAFAGAGMKLALADRDGARLAEAKVELEAVTAVEAYELDVRDRAAYASIADSVEAALGPVSLLCNNAGVAGAFSLQEMSYELWDLVIGVNLIGTINGIQTFLPRMMARGEPGHIVNTSAGSGLVSGSAAAGFMYQTSKFGVVGLTETLRKHLKMANLPISATVFCPGPVASNIVSTTLSALPASFTTNLSAAQQAERDARTAISKQWLAASLPIDEAGRMVLDGVRRDALYVHTDRVIYDALLERTKEIIESFPETETAPVSSEVLNALLGKARA